MDTARLKKQVALLRKMGMFNPADETFAIRRAHTAADLEAAYRLVHDSFVEKGYINQQPGGMRIRPYEMVPQTATFICEHKERGEIVAVMSVVVDSLDMGLPSDHAFQDELDELRSQGRRVCEFTNLAVAGKYWRSNAFTALTQACHAQAKFTNCDNIFIAISPGHAQFFESILGFERRGEPRDYGCDKKDIVQGQCLDLHTVADRFVAIDTELDEQGFLYDYYFGKNPYDKLVCSWEESATPDLDNARQFHRLLSITARSYKPKSSQPYNKMELSAIRNRWGDKFFWVVQGAQTIPIPGAVWAALWRGVPLEAMHNHAQAAPKSVVSY